MTAQGINLVVALRAEASPLIESFGLKRSTSIRNHEIYTNDHLSLIVSGMGKAAAVNAVQALHAQVSDQVSAWLNIGIAGHGLFEIEQGFLASRITDQESSQSWYPMIVYPHDCAVGPLMTVNEVELRYPEPIGYDMEAAAFFSAAKRHATVELVQSYKVVSDNPHHSVSRITPARISKLIEMSIEEIRQLINALDQLVAQVGGIRSTDGYLKPFLERWKFTVSQQHQLKRLLRKNNVLSHQFDADSHALQQCQDARAVIRTLQDNLDAHWGLNGVVDV